MSSWGARTMLAFHASPFSLANQNCLLGGWGPPHPGLHPRILHLFLIMATPTPSIGDPTFLSGTAHCTPFCGLPTLVLFHHCQLH